jgi:thermitase
MEGFNMRKKFLLLITLLIGIPLAFSMAWGERMVSPRADVGSHVPGEVVVGFQPDATEDQIEVIVSSMGGEITGKSNLPRTRIRKVRLPSTAQSILDETINGLKTNPAVRYAEPNRIIWLHGKGDPLIYQQWAYYDVGADWISPPSSTTAPLVAVIDTGVDYTHPDLVDKIIKGRDFINADGDPMDDYGHGTHVAGVITAKKNNGYGIAGISPKSKVLAIKAISSQGYGSDFDIAQALAYAADYSGVRVINMSLGGDYSDTQYDAVYYAVVTKNKLLIASAGNGGSPIPDYPAGFADLVTYPEFENRVLAVAAHGTDHCRASWSNYGAWVSTTAPGVSVLSTVPPHMDPFGAGFGEWNGTSMAAPHVSAAAALAWLKYPSYKNTQIAQLIMTRHAGLWDPLLRDDACWPDDGSTFERLDILHIIHSVYYEDGVECNGKGTIWGYAMDAETGEPLAGAKAIAKLNSQVVGTEIVSYVGTLTNFKDDSVIDADYGLFGLLAKSGSIGLQFEKEGFANPTFKNINVDSCGQSYAGRIAVPPNKGKYWLVITWDTDYAGDLYDSFLYVPEYGYIDPYWNSGTLTDSPFAKVLWDSDDPLDFGNRRSSEAIRIKKTVSGDYFYYIWAYTTTGEGSIGSTSWYESGIKAYIYKWDSSTATQKLVKTYTPPPGGSGQYWDICLINGNTITDLNRLTDEDE